MLTAVEAEYDQKLGTRAEQVATIEKLKRIRKHCFNLQQLPEMPVITANEQAVARLEHAKEAGKELAEIRQRVRR
jgi:hypothetical protein